MRATGKYDRGASHCPRLAGSTDRNLWAVANSESLLTAVTPL
jgi:hypothetical protein